MPNTRLVGFPVIDTISGPDLFYVLKDPGGVETEHKVTFTQAGTYIATAVLTLSNKTLVAPILGTPQSGNLGSCTDYEGASIASTGESAGTKFLRENGDGSSSWQLVGAIQNVKDLGAQGDGSTDDTAVIQAALDNAGIVYFPAGTYIVEPLSIPSDTLVVGDGMFLSILKLKTNSIPADDPLAKNSLLANETIKASAFGGSGDRDENIEVRDIGLDGNKANQTSTYSEAECLSFYGVDTAIVQNVRCINAVADGYDLDYCDNIHAYNLIVKDCDKTGIHFSVGSPQSVDQGNDNCSVSGAVITGCGASGLTDVYGAPKGTNNRFSNIFVDDCGNENDGNQAGAVALSSRNSILENVAINNTTGTSENGLYLGGVDNVISHVQIKGATGSGLLAEGSGLNVTNAKIEDATGNGVLISGSTDSVFTNVRSEFSLSHGIRLSTSTRVSLIGCSGEDVVTADRFGIFIFDNNDNCLVQACTAKGNLGGQIVIQKTNTNCRIDGCIIESGAGSGGSGIQLIHDTAANNNNEITGNMIRDASNLLIAGITIDASNIGTLISGNNILESNLSGSEIVDNGTGTLVYNNPGDGTRDFNSSTNTNFVVDANGIGNSITNIDVADHSATGTPSSSTYYRGDNTWATIAGSGDVSKVGTPADSQIGVWTGDGTIEGDAALTFDSSTGILAIIGALDVDNININGNTIISTDANGNITLTPDGTGDIALGTLTINGDQAVGAGQDNFVLTYDDATGLINLEVAAAGGSKHVIEDDGSPRTARAKLNFVGAGVTVTDDSGDDATVVTILSGGDVAQSGTNVMTGSTTFIDNTLFFENVSGTQTGKLQNSNTANRTYVLQDSNHTIVGRDTTDTLSNKTLVAPVLGTPQSGNLGSCTSYPGDSSLAVVGTITTGAWNGTPITGANINAASTDLTDTANIVYHNGFPTFPGDVLIMGGALTIFGDDDGVAFISHVRDNTATSNSLFAGVFRGDSTSRTTGFGISILFQITGSDESIGALEFFEETGLNKSGFRVKINNYTDDCLTIDNAGLVDWPLTGAHTNFVVELGGSGNDITGTAAEFDSSCTDDSFAYVGATNVFTVDQTLNDNVNLKFGTGGDADIDYDGSDLKINPQVAGSGNVDIVAGDVDVLAGAVKEAGIEISPIGVHDMWIGATGMWPSTTGGCADIVKTEIATNQDIQTLDFDGSSTEAAQFEVSFPKNWDAGTITATFYWSSTAADTDDVDWRLSGVSIGDNVLMTLAYGTPITVTDAHNGVANEHNISTATAAITLNGAGKSKGCRFLVERVGGSDTMTEDSRLHGIMLHITTDAANAD